MPAVGRKRGAAVSDSVCERENGKNRLFERWQMKEEIKIMRACRQRNRMSDKRLIEFHKAVVKLAIHEPEWRAKAQELLRAVILPKC